MCFVYLNQKLNFYVIEKSEIANLWPSFSKQIITIELLSFIRYSSSYVFLNVEKINYFIVTGTFV